MDLVQGKPFRMIMMCLKGFFAVFCKNSPLSARVIDLKPYFAIIKVKENIKRNYVIKLLLDVSVYNYFMKLGGD